VDPVNKRGLGEGEKMSTDVTIGIPKGLFYFQYKNFWEFFFKELGIKTIVSEDTHKEMLDNGVKYSSNETCLPVKVFLGHVYSLKDKADYVFIPRYTTVAENEYTCPKFCGLPDMIYFSIKKQVL
jgi:predicted nucleotide-binding protein (sugar kinase/HSP70/actin superfamily)